MIKQKILAIIPARGGSKRIKGKNLKELDNQPLIQYSLNAALKSGYIDDVVVSSNDEAILSLAKRNGVSTIRRREILSTDTAKSIDVIKDVLNKFKNYEYAVTLQPTSPLRNEDHIDSAIELLFEKKADAVVSVCKSDPSPLWMNTISSDLKMDGFIKTENLIRSQDLENYYQLNGAIYINKVSRLISEDSLIFADNIYAYIMNRESSIDIDENYDFSLAESFFTAMETANIALAPSFVFCLVPSRLIKRVSILSWLWMF